jgi:hypothetical protein
MNNERAPLPESLQIANALIPIVCIKAVPDGFSLEVSKYTPSPQLVPRDKWKERLDATNNAVQTNKFWTDFQLAYDFVREQANAFPTYDEENLASNVSILAEDESWNVTSLAIYNMETMRMFINTSFHSDAEIIESDWQYFLDTYDSYETSKHDFFTAYEFVNSHPMFWRLHGDLNNSNSLAWDTLNGFDVVHHTVFRGTQPGDIVHQFEGGPASCEPREWNIHGYPSHCVPRRISSLDTAITASAETYELAVIAFARKIYKFYSLETAHDWMHGCQGHV